MLTGALKLERLAARPVSSVPPTHTMGSWGTTVSDVCMDALFVDYFMQDRTNSYKFVALLECDVILNKSIIPPRFS